ncbi:hypothetical protein ACHWQZ_G004436 [Mnemiopsis leidyi]
MLNEVLENTRDTLPCDLQGFADDMALVSVLSAIDWEEIRHSDSFEEFPAKFTSKVLEICLENVPRKQPPSGKPRIYNSLRRKKSTLNIRLLAAKGANNAACVKKLEDEVGLLSFKIKEAIVRHLDESERRAVGKIKENPKYFYSYAKFFSKVKHSISTLLDGEKKLVTDSKDLADILQTQFCSVFSNPTCPDKSMPEFALRNSSCHLS